uniref:Uncharacterized protein n=1 Tax=Arundo donax TaxID=35708 RepID=A0A0A9B2D1_ARUDO
MWFKHFKVNKPVNVSVYYNHGHAKMKVWETLICIVR